VGTTKIRYWFIYGASTIEDSVYLEVWYDTYVGIEEYNNNFITISPNPTIDAINFSKDVNNVYLFNTQGQLLYCNNKTNKINIEFFENGIYFINYEYNNLKFNKKIIKI
jgi:hypothetical protein